MAKKKKYTVRVAYKVYDYYDVEATSEERAIEMALEQSADDSLNDFIQEGRGEGLVTIIDGKPVEPKKPEPQYVWVHGRAGVGRRDGGRHRQGVRHGGSGAQVHAVVHPRRRRRVY